MCVNQHTFFMNFEQNHASQANLNLFQNIPEHFNESREDLLSTDEKMYYSNSQLTLPHNSNTNLTVSTNNMYIPSTESLHNPMMESRTSLQTSALDVNLPVNNIIMGSSQWNNAGSNSSLVNRAQSSSCIDLTNSNANINNLTNNNNNNNSKEKFLPKYRTPPAYDFAIQQKYKGSQQLHQQQQQEDVSIMKNPHALMYENFHQQQAAAANKSHYPDVTHVTTLHASNNMINPSYVDASDHLSQRLNMLSFNPPTHHYPVSNRLSSTSTPDLASHRGLFGYRPSGSSPNLTLFHQQHGYHHHIPSNAHSILYPYVTTAASSGMKHRLRHSNSFLPHATYENLNFIEATNPSFFPSSKHIPNNNNMIYRTSSSAQQLAADMEYYMHKQQQLSLNALNLSNSHISEPIYENVPLPTTAERKISANNNNVNNTNMNRPVRPRPRLIHTENNQQSSKEIVSSANNNTTNMVSMTCRVYT